MINWREELKKICKNVKYDEPMSKHTSFRIGGPASAFIQVTNKYEIQKLIQESPKWNLPIMMLGRGTNVLFDDSGYKGIIVNLVGEFKKIKFDKKFVTIGAGISLNRLTNECAKSGLSGLEFAYGIPGSVGGGLIMNAGAHGSSMSDVVKQVQLIDNQGNLISISGNQANFGYRKSCLEQYFAVIGAKLELVPEKPEKIKEKMKELFSIRKGSQPLGEYSAGCVFKNPQDDSAGRIIDQCGLKGKMIGGAQVSLKHANFIVNKGDAKAKDIRELIYFVREEVKKRKGVEFELELKIL